MATAKYEHIAPTRGVLEGWKRQDANNTKAVVFVHGFWGSVAKTWKAKEAQKSFPEFMVNDTNLSDFDIYTFQYETSVLGKIRIDRLAQQFDNTINLSLNGYQLVLLAHSMGGLVCMQYILDKLQRAQRPPVLGLILYGTPTTGLEWLQIIRLAGGLVFKLPIISSAVTMLADNVGDLAVASTVLQKLHSEWVLRVANGGHASVPANQKAWFPVRVVTGNEDWVVPEHSARGIYGQIDWHPLQTDHYGLVKPDGCDHAQYQAAASFLIECRRAKPQEAVLKLKAASDWVWQLLNEPLIRDWRLKLGFDEPITAADTKLLTAPGFSICEVTKSQWVFVLPDKPISLGLALGRAATENAWSEHNPVYIHGIRLDTVQPAERGPITAAINAQTGSAQTAWDSSFSNVRMRIREVSGAQWHNLVQAPPILGSDFVISDFSVPSEAQHLVGKDVELDFGFRTIRPSTLTEHTWHFKWLTHGANVEINVKNAQFLFAAPHTIGLTKFDVSQVEDYQIRKTIRVRTDEIVLPDTVVRFRWSAS